MIIRLLISLLFVTPSIGCAQSSGIVEPQGYKLEDYRSPTTETLQGATVVDAEQAVQLHSAEEVYFIDVLPAPIKPTELGEHDLWLPKKHSNIPGSIWLPDIGYGLISDELENYFKTNIELLLKESEKGLLFYCKADCWMSWNAARRAMEYGYKNVYWFPGGIDDWLYEDERLEVSTPVAIE